ncbi:MAG: hypothetical protein M1164_01915 [Candidatus Marsarchaeota archaeon]|nr:hypothetical protein [Candidatus Marsarchaeota archaeon]
MNTSGEVVFSQEKQSASVRKPPEIKLVDETAIKESASMMLSIRKEVDAALVKVLRDGMDQDPIRAKVRYEKEVYAQSVKAVKKAAKALPKDDEYKDLAKNAFFTRMMMRVSSFAARISMMHEYDYEDKIRDIEFRADSSFSIMHVFMADAIAALSCNRVLPTGEFSLHEYLKSKMESRYNDTLLRRGLKYGEVVLVEVE